MPNRLAQETSPYLLQHAHNPVEWYPWGEEALEKARREDKPIFLSIGYSACHWCHVMERESFEDPEIAAVMNERFVNVKVDREERPDLDTVYMQAVQLMTGQGGWPMSVWLTPDLEPFYGGTYFPPASRYGMPSFRSVLEQLSDTWAHRREDIGRAASELTEALERMSSAPPAATDLLSEDLLDHAARALRSNYDPYHGGFGSAPKFPASMNLRFLLRYWKRAEDRRSLDMVENTLRKMARGGVYDQLGGGFHRYSVDAEWLVPHFEKMLYDNALLVPCYVEVWQATRDGFHRRVAEETLDYLLREMTSPEGGFYSTQDADSEGEEGRFFVWTPEQVREVLGDDAPVAEGYWGVTAHGNFEHGRSVLHVAKDDDVAAHLLGLDTGSLQERLPDLRRRLHEAREQRVKPGRDEKVLAAWNGMALTAFAQAFGAFGHERYREAARRNADFLLTKMSREDGRLYRSYKDPRAGGRLNAYLEDYALVAEGLLELYFVDLDPRWLEEARRLTDLTLERFWDDDGETFWFTETQHEQLLTRPRDLFDNATPSGNSVAMLNLLRLHRLTGEARYEEIAVRALKRLAGTVRRSPAGFGLWLQALDFHLQPPVEVALVGDEVDGFVKELYGRFVPHKVVARGPGPAVPFLEGKTPVDGRAAAYLCQGATCLPPVTEPSALATELDR